MTLCPIAVVATCKKCPVFAICPAKGILGDHVAEDKKTADSNAKKPAGKK